MSALANHFGDLAAAAGGPAQPAWIQKLRARGQERFLAHGLPHRRLEDWKYTPLDVRDAPGDAPASAGPLQLDGAVSLDLVDGEPGPLPESLPEGVEVLGLAEALAGDPKSLKPLMEALEFDHPSQAMTALNSAGLGRGLVLRVADGVDAGLLALSWRRAPGNETVLVNARVLVELGQDARLDLVEHVTAGGALNVVHQCRLGAASRLRHARLQDSPSGSWLITRTETLQDRDSRFEQASLDLGAGLARHDLRIRLGQDGASCDLRGAYLPAGDAHVDHHLEVRHEAPGCRSDQTFRGVLRDRGRAVFSGRVHVLPGADDSEAHQSNQNLLLSRDAEVDTKPELIIEADEVIASHGATVGQLDENAVFYLRSRGIDADTARRLLTGGFCRSVVDGIGIDAARAAFHERLEQALEVQS